MTEKLFYKNTRLTDFSAVVQMIREKEGKFHILLDRSAFFPEGGGQSGDRGTIENCKVIDTQLENDEILHLSEDCPHFSVGDTVHCVVDGALRFARMQAHSGEHIVSGLAHRLYGAENVGFHMNGLLMTVDFDLPLSKSELKRIEEKANDCVYRNVPVRAWFPTVEEAEKIQYRSKLENVDGLRLVEIEGYDVCACCAPHVDRTGEIGLIKILTSVSHRGGVRITLICGRAAYEDYAIKYDNTLYCADLLKAKHNELPAALDALLEKEATLRQKLAAASGRFVDQVIAASVETGEGVICFTADASMDELCRIVSGIAEKYGVTSAAFSGDDCKGYCFAVFLRDESQLPFFRTFLQKIRGRGGGRNLFLQGKCEAAEQEIRCAFDEITAFGGKNS